MKTAHVTEIRTLDFYGQVADVKYVWTFTVPTADGGERVVTRETTDLDPAVTCDCPISWSDDGDVRKLTDCDCQNGYVVAENEEPEVKIAR